MSTIPIESKMDFDYSVSTENRFALRNWLDCFIVSVNQNNPSEYDHMFSELFFARGFGEAEMDKAQFLQFLRTSTDTPNGHIIRLPELKIKLQAGTYRITGTFEQFDQRILTYEGTVEIAVSRTEDVFAFEKIIFFPRLKLTVEK